MVFEGLAQFADPLARGARLPVWRRASSTSRSRTGARAFIAPVRMDTVAVRRFGPDGQPAGERLFVGLFTSAAYAENSRTIPVLRRKVGRALERAGFARRATTARRCCTSSNISEGRTVPDRGRRAVGHRARYPWVAGASADRALRAARSLWTVRVDVRLCAARALQHGAAAAHGRDPGEGLPRQRSTASPTLIDDGVLARVHFLLRTPPEAVEIDRAAVERDWPRRRGAGPTNLRTRWSAVSARSGRGSSALWRRPFRRVSRAVPGGRGGRRYRAHRGGARPVPLGVTLIGADTRRASCA